MLKKLYKHEFHALYRWLLPVYGVLMALAVFCKIGLTLYDAMQDGGYVGSVFMTTTVVLYLLGIVGLCIISLALIVARFYRHLLTSEGYLTFTLPVTVRDHIFCKLFCGAAAALTSIAALAVSLLIVGAGTSSLHTVLYGFSHMFEGVELSVKGHIAGFTVEGILLVILTIFGSLLTFYAAMALGQLFQKSRVGGAVLWYVIIQIILQIIAAMISISLIATGNGWFSWMERMQPTTAMHAFMVVLIVVQAVYCAVFYGITHYMLSKRLNLE